MRGLILFLCVIGFLHAGIFDFLDVAKAQKSYDNKDYKAAIKSYKKIDTKQGAAYDLGNSYYKNKQYKEALSEYEKVTDKNLEFKKLHNMGNTYAHLGKIDDAIKSYEEALKIKKDKDTQYNLDLLKKQKKKEQKKNKNNNKKQQNKNNKDQKNKQDRNQDRNKNDQNRQNKKDQQKKQNKNNKQNDQKKKDQKRSQNKDQKKSKPESKKEKNRKKDLGSVKKAPPISNMEERKYRKMLDNRGINTLMLPINTKGDRSHETNPW